MEKSRHSADVRGEMSDASELSDLFDRMPVALYRTDLDGNLLAANQALASLLGYRDISHLSSALDSVYSVYVDPTDRERWLRELNEKGVVYDFDVAFKRADGSTVWVQDTARAIEDETGQVMYYEGALVDVTEKVAATKARDQFLATVSHELRNPVAVVVGLSQELADRYESFDDDERRDMTDMIARQAEDASWLIEDLLVAYRDDLSQVSISLEEVDVLDDVERVLEVLDHDVKLEVCHEKPAVRADPRRARQIIRNLVNNAVNYGGDEITVRIEKLEEAVEVRVCDSGEPIAEDEVEEIFEAFRRGRGPSHPTSVGLGLPVARNLARLMGGDVTYAYEDGYSCFTLRLPAA